MTNPTLHMVQKFIYNGNFLSGEIFLNFIAKFHSAKFCTRVSTHGTAYKVVQMVQVGNLACTVSPNCVIKSLTLSLIEMKTYLPSQSRLIWTEGPTICKLKELHLLTHWDWCSCCLDMNGIPTATIGSKCASKCKVLNGQFRIMCHITDTLFLFLYLTGVVLIDVHTEATTDFTVPGLFGEYHESANTDGP